MCRYAWHSYRDHFACFDCGKTFKYWQWAETDFSTLTRKQQLEHLPRDIACPDCTKPMADMGLDFKAPPKNDSEAWEIMRILYAHGFTFHSCGCCVGLKPPHTLREVPGWLDRHRKRSDSEKLLDQFAERGRR